MDKTGEPAVIFEDNRILVVIKPQNVPCVADDSGDESLQQQLKDFIKTRDNKGGEVFVGVVHRLDRVTGGVMVFAKNSKAAERLSEQIKDGTMKKTYLAVVSGEPKQKSAVLVNYLVKDENKNIVSVVPQSTKGAKRAELFYETAGTAGEMPAGKTGGIPIGTAGEMPADKANFRTASPRPRYTLLRVHLTTGRSHQIRVQLKHIGCPLVGDNRYGGEVFYAADNKVKNSKTQGHIALWAYQLEFIHPTNGDNMKFIVNPPENGVWANFDFDRRLHKLGGQNSAEQGSGGQNISGHNSGGSDG